MEVIASAVVRELVGRSESNTQTMEMITSAFVPELVRRLDTLVSEEVVVLLGVKEELKDLQRKLNRIRGVLDDAEERKLSDTDIRNWLVALRDVSYDVDDIIDDCRKRSQKQRSLMSEQPNRLVYCYTSLLSRFDEIKSSHKIRRKINSVKHRVSEIARKGLENLQLIPTTMSTTQEGEARQRMSRRRLGFPVFEESNIEGLDKDAEMLVTLLTEGNQRELTGCAITGEGGIGKTTLAQKVYNHIKIKMHFHSKMWIYVSHNFNESGLLKEIIRSAGETCGESESIEELVIKLEKVLKRKTLIVLDDVPSIHYCQFFHQLYSGVGSMFLVTTSMDPDAETGLRMIYIHRARRLNDREGWGMICKKVFVDMDGEEIPTELRDVGMEIVERCDGLPLAIKAVAGVLASKSERTAREWRKVLDSSAWNGNPHQINGIHPALYLSYMDLPSLLKHYFIYSSLVLNGTGVESNFASSLFIAEGFMESQGETTVENIAEDCFEELISRNLLEIAEESPFTGKVWKMHDSLQDLASIIAGEGHFCGDFRTLYVHPILTRRISLKSSGLSTIPSTIEKSKGLRTLVLSHNKQLESVPEGILSKLGRLRVLDLSFTGIESLPNSLGKLIHLRCLQLCNTRLRELPDSLCNLQNLQTLDVRHCQYLQRLPEDLASLYCLRHLLIDGTRVEYMPSGIGKLLSLQTLSKFVVGSGSDGGEDQRGCNIEELQNLVQLRHLSMTNLERVPSKAEAEKANLGNKSKLCILVLECFLEFDCWDFEVTEDQIKMIEEVYEALSPPPSLEQLEVVQYLGTKWPSWISEPSLSHVNTLIIRNACLVEQLPSLGQLPNLNVLCIKGTRIKSIGPEFFGDARSFPMLQKLELSGMVDLEGWEWMEKGSMPSLVFLGLSYCPKLRSLPEGLQHLTRLQRLDIECCSSLREIKNLSSITYLCVMVCPMLEAISNLTALQEMYIYDCPGLKDLGELTRVKVATFVNFGGFRTALPEWLQHMTSLELLFLNVDGDLLTRCMVDGEEWPKIKHVSRVHLESPTAAIVHTNTPNGHVTTDEEMQDTRFLHMW